MRENIGEKWGG